MGIVYLIFWICRMWWNKQLELARERLQGERQAAEHPPIGMTDNTKEVV